MYLNKFLLTLKVLLYHIKTSKNPIHKMSQDWCPESRSYGNGNPFFTQADTKKSSKK